MLRIVRGGRLVSVSLVLLVALFGLALAAACGDDDDTASTATVINSLTPTPGGAASASASAVTSPSSSASASASTGSGSAATATVDITAKDTAFDKKDISVPAGAQVTVNMTNQDAIIHNIAFYPDKSAVEKDAYFIGELFKGPNVTKTESFKAPTKPGVYYFHCDVHPDQMNGTFTVK
jgi:plastocyanin